MSESVTCTGVNSTAAGFQSKSSDSRQSNRRSLYKRVTVDGIFKEFRNCLVFLILEDQTRRIRGAFHHHLLRLDHWSGV